MAISKETYKVYDQVKQYFQNVELRIEEKTYTLYLGTKTILTYDESTLELGDVIMRSGLLGILGAIESSKSLKSTLKKL